MCTETALNGERLGWKARLRMDSLADGDRQKKVEVVSERRSTDRPGMDGKAQGTRSVFKADV